MELDESAIDLDLDGVEDWAADSVALLGEPDLPPVALEFIAVRDLDLVDPDRWPRALELLARPPLRAALVDRTRVRLADGRHADVPSYTAWWLRRHLVLDGHRPGDLLAPDADPLLAGLYDPIDAPARSPTRRSPARSASGARWPTCWPSRAAPTSCWPGWPTRPGRSPARSCGRCGRRWRARTATGRGRARAGAG